MPALSGESAPKKESVKMKGYLGTSESTNATNFEAILVNGTASYTARP